MNRILTQQKKDKNKLYALHAPEVECIGKGKARKPYEFGVKASFATTHKRGLMVGARTFPGNPYDGHVLSAQLEQTAILLEDIGRKPKEVIVDLGYRGVDDDNPGVAIIHRGKFKSLTKTQRKWLKRRQAIEPAIGHLFDPLLHLLPADWASTVGHSLSIAIAFALVTMLAYTFGVIIAHPSAPATFPLFLRVPHHPDAQARCLQR